MPGVGSTLDVGWDLAGATLDADPNNVGFGAVPQVAFNNIGLDPGSFASGVAAQALSNIVSALGPVISIAQKVSAPIPGIGPILNKLGLGGTFIDIIAGPGSPTAEAVKKVAGLGDIVSAVNNIAKNGGTAVDFGSISFTTDGNGADIRSDAFSLGNVTPHVTTLGPGASASATLKNSATVWRETVSRSRFCRIPARYSNLCSGSPRISSLTIRARWWRSCRILASRSLSFRA